MSDSLPRWLRWRLYYWIDLADTWVLKHPRTPGFIRIPVARAWCWMMDQGTWTAVGDTPYYGIDIDKCYINGCRCGRPKPERQTEW